MNWLSPGWLEILSELFVNLAAGWLIFVFIEPQLGPVKNPLLLTLRFILGILTLIIAKYFRDRSKKL